MDIDSILSVSADEEDGFDAFSAMLSADSMSMSDDVRDYVFENSRRYHKYSEGRYHFPNDDAEQEREDMQHAMVMLLCDGKLHYAPLHNPQSVLDIGTGTGIWAIDSKLHLHLLIGSHLRMRPPDSALTSPPSLPVTSGRRVSRGRGIRYRSQPHTAYMGAS